MTATSNWKRTCTTPSFQLLENRAPHYGRQWGSEPFVFTDTSRLIAWTPKVDANGQYTMKREIILPILDATVLRTCKLLYGYGSQILYGYNNFDFHTFDGHNEIACPPRSRIMEKDYRPNPKKPRGDNNWEGKINEGITQISLRRPITMLEGYVYHDPFLRFLHTIGPKNASLIQNLGFTGRMKLHFCSEDNCSQKCADDLATSIQVYIPFIRQFCKGLHTLTLFPLKDEFWGPDTAPRGGPQNFKEAVSRLVRDSLSKTGIENLFVFEYVPEYVPQTRDLEDTDDEDFGGAGREMNFKRPGKNVLHEFAMAEWAKARNANRETETEEGTAYYEEIARDSECEFCGEKKHVWPDCHNLCKICGEYGHWGSLCPRVQKRWYE